MHFRIYFCKCHSWAKTSTFLWTVLFINNYDCSVWPS